MPYDEDTKVFDVAKPSKSQPDSTSRPVIVGHRPQMNDPMVKENSAGTSNGSGTPIHVAMADEEPLNPLAHPAEPTAPSIEPETPSEFASHYGDAKVSEHEEEVAGFAHQEHEETAKEPALPNAPAPEHDEGSKEEKTEEASNFTSLNSLITEEGEDPEAHNDNTTEVHHPDHGGDWHEADPLPVTKGAGPKKRWPKVLGMLFLLALLVAAVGYLAVDDGLVQSNVKLPFHIFNKQKFPGTTATSSPPPISANNPTPAPASHLPNGFSAYKLAGTEVSFAYPTAWGAPTTMSDPGFSKRGGANKSDGTYAYLVNFATNKDVQLAFTSSKYLPAARGALYYDSLQWCSGTNDGKFYKQALHFTTVNAVDTPGTIACDQGPLTDATKIDNSSIVQLNTKDAAGKSLGDLYTENLSSNDLSVLHIKDAAMKSSTDIKQLLTTVKIASSAGQ
jgi:hypothetical protein